MPYEVQSNGNGTYRSGIANHIDTDNLDEVTDENQPATCSCHDNDYPPFTGEIHVRTLLKIDVEKLQF